MDFIIELILELFLEGSIEISSNRKISKWIRYPLIILIVTLFVAVISLIFYVGLSLLNDFLLLAIFFILIAIIMFTNCIIKFKKIYIEKKK